MELNRRGFLKGVGTVGAFGALGAAGTLVGCSPKQQGAGDVDAKAGPLTAETVEQQWSFMIPPEPVPDSKIAETFSAEVVVVGAGMPKSSPPTCRKASS